jgi:cell division septation protein DedD
LAPGLKTAVEPVEGKNSFRALLTGFPDTNAARDYCNRLKGRGIDCFVRAP